MTDLHYINEKLSNAINTFTVDEGDARKRIAAALPDLKKVTPENLPPDLEKDFKWAMETIERGRSKVLRNMPDNTLPHIENSTASKVIKKIVYIQYKIETLLSK